MAKCTKCQKEIKIGRTGYMFTMPDSNGLGYKLICFNCDKELRVIVEKWFSDKK